jgi:predicted permease
MSGRRFSGSVFIQGRTYAPGQRDVIYSVGVSPTFFETMEMPLVSGRGITPLDTQDAPRVVVINEAAARKYFPNESPIGRRIGSSVEASGSQEIVGVLRDAKYNSIRDAAVPTKYGPFAQGFQGTATFEVRTAGDPLAVVAGIRDAVRHVDPTLPLMNITTQLEEVERRFEQEKVFAQAYTLFGGLALLVASIGLFGVMSYSVARRTNEIGIRMALGAERRRLVWMVLREVLLMAIVGLAIGIPAAIATSHFVGSFLFQMKPNDPLAFTLAAVSLLAAALLAGYGPAWRASRIDPWTALRDE